jgi:hypothetical protein
MKRGLGAKMNVHTERAAALAQAAELLSVSLRELLVLRERVALAEASKLGAQACGLRRNPNRYQHERNNLRAMRHNPCGP